MSENTNDDNDNVINIRPERFRLITGVSVKEGRRCCHFQTQRFVDHTARRVWCECGADLDPMDILFEIANDAQWVMVMRREKLSLSQQIETLKNERDALKSSVAGLKKRRGVRHDPSAG